MTDRTFELAMSATYRRVDFERGFVRPPVEVVRRRPVVFGSGSTLGRVGGEPLLLREVSARRAPKGEDEEPGQA